MRFNYDRSVDTQPLSAAATDLQQRVSTPVNGALELLHIFNPHLVNEVKFGFNRATSNSYNYSKTGSIYQIAISTGPGPGFVTQNYNYNSIYVGNSFSGIDNLTWIHGRQTFKAGGEIRHIQLNQEYGEHGKVTFSTVENLAANAGEKSKSDWCSAGQRLAQERYHRLRPGRVQVAAQSHPEPGRALHHLPDLSTRRTGWPTPSISTPAGRRDSAAWAPASASRTTAISIRAWASPGRRDKSGKTVVRAGFGTYHEDGQLDDQNLPAKNEVPSYSVKSIEEPAGDLSGRLVLYRPRNPLTECRTTGPQGLVC